MRSTDLQAFIGLGQLDKLNSIVEARNRNYLHYTENINGKYWKAPQSTDEKYISNFAYPIIHPLRYKIVENLKAANISVRPLICGSLEKQPFWNNGGKINMVNGDIIDNYGLYLPNNHQLTADEIDKICKIVNNT